MSEDRGIGEEQRYGHHHHHHHDHVEDSDEVRRRRRHRRHHHHHRHEHGSFDVLFRLLFGGGNQIGGDVGGWF